MKRMLISAAALFLFAVGGSHLAAQQIDVLRYRAVITFEPTARTIDGRAELDIRNASRSPMRTVALDLRDLTVRQVRQGGNALTFAHEDNILTVTLAAPVESNDSVTVEVEYGGTPTSESGSPSWGGCFWGDPSFAMGVGFTAPYVSMTRHWLPSHDEPDDKAAFDLTYIVPQGYSAAGTGVLAGVRDEGAGTAWRWVETHPTATYLVTWAVGHYALVESSWNGIPMMFFVPKADSAKAVTWFQPLTGMLDAYSRMFGPYPFDKVGYCLTPIGSMEHQTMVSLAQSVFDGATKAEMTVAHELAHQWWGDCVTARDFRHAWLSEGFAQYSETVYLEKSISRASYLSQTRANNTIYKNTVEPYEGTFALYDFPRAAPSSNYPMTIYYKGSSVLAMLRMVMGDSAFFDGLRRYRAAHEYGAATTADFQAAMEEASSINLPWFFDEWVYKPGYPNYQIQRVKDPAGPLRVRILQIQDTSRIPLFRMPLPEV